VSQNAAVWTVYVTLLKVESVTIPAAVRPLLCSELDSSSFTALCLSGKGAVTVCYYIGVILMQRPAS
jgi:hypothetical protein